MPKGIYKRNEEEILRLRKLRLGITPWNKGKKRPPFTEEWIANMKKSAKKRNPPTEETKTKISESKKGERNPFWKGGISPVNRIIRRSKELRLWRESVFKRDNYTCVWCGGKGRIQADHIKPFCLFPELRFNIKNGRTLCKPCHLKTDTWGTKKELTKLPKQWKKI